MFVFQAAGDAYGAAFEFLDFERYHPNDGTHYYVQPDTGLGNALYTDDTQMNLAMFSAIKKYGNRVNALRIADEFVAFYRRDPRDGYATGFKNLLNECEDGADLLAKIRPNSTRSGAIMRAPAVGGFKDVADVLRISRMQAEITHNTPQAIESSQAVSLAMHFILFNPGKESQLREFISDNVEFKQLDWMNPRREWATIEAYDCAANAITAYLDSNTVQEVLQNSVHWGGDTDTVAATAMCFAWASSSIATNPPNLLVSSVEQPTDNLGLDNMSTGFPFLLEFSRDFHEFVQKQID
jgi:ADP-ribosylglycohydrolase